MAVKDRGRARSVDAKADAKDKAGARARAASAVAAVKEAVSRVAVPALPYKRRALQVSIVAALESEISVSVQNADLDGKSAPGCCSAGSESTFHYSTKLQPNVPIKGKVTIGGFSSAIQFSAARDGSGTASVHAEGTQTSRRERADHHGAYVRHTMIGPTKTPDGEDVEAPRAVDAEITVPHIGTVKIAHLRLRVRPATAGEVQRTNQLRALQEAVGNCANIHDEICDYGSIQAQVTKAKMYGISIDDIEKGEIALRELRRAGKHVDPGAEKEELRSKMQWSLVTHKDGPHRVVTPCPGEGCECNQERLGEVLEFKEGHVQQLLQGFGCAPGEEDG